MRKKKTFLKVALFRTLPKAQGTFQKHSLSSLLHAVVMTIFRAHFNPADLYKKYEFKKPTFVTNR